MTRPHRNLAIMTALALLLAASLAYAAAGDLSQKPGVAGCISESGTAGACQDGAALDAAVDLAISADGKSVYVASAFSDAVAILDRNPASGELTQKAGTAGCVSETGTAGACQDGVALNNPEGIAISADGKSVYSASSTSDAVAIFDRNPASGELTQKPGPAGCVSEDGTGGACQDGVAFDGANAVTVSPDGRSVYASTFGSDSVAILDRDQTTGALTQKPGTAGCISQTSSGGACQDGRALGNAGELAVSADGKSVYIASSVSYAVAILDRNTTSGELTQKAGTAGCVSETGGDGDGAVCQDGRGLTFVSDVAVSPDGRSVYTVSQYDAVAILDRNLASGELNQKPGPAGCISDTGDGGGCQDGVALDNLSGVAVSPDGNSVYVASYASDALVILDRNASSELTQRPGTAGCISDIATGYVGCQGGKALDGAADVALSPDGRSVYVAAETADAMAVFDRAGPPQAVVPPPDTTPPGTLIRGAMKRIKTIKKRADFKVAFVSTEPGSSFECRFDKRPFRPCASPKKLKAKLGKHTFAVRAIDAAGNVDPTPATRRFKVVEGKKATGKK